MERFSEIVNSMVDLFNKYFYGLFIVCLLSLILFIIYKKIQITDSRKWWTLIYVIKNKLLQIFIQIIIISTPLFFLYKVYDIDLLNVEYVNRYLKIVFTIWIILHFKSGCKLYIRKNRHLIFEDIEHSRDAELIYLSSIENLTTSCEIKFEKIGILKSLAPVALIPLLAGNIIEGKDIKINWNWYTIIFLFILSVYCYSLWKSYYDLKSSKVELNEIKVALLRYNEKNKNRKIEL